MVGGIESNGKKSKLTQFIDVVSWKCMRGSDLVYPRSGSLLMATFAPERSHIKIFALGGNDEKEDEAYAEMTSIKNDGLSNVPTPTPHPTYKPIDCNDGNEKGKKC